MNLHDYLWKEVKLTTKKGRVFKGEVNLYISPLDNYPDEGKECIGIGNINFNEDEIASIELI